MSDEARIDALLAAALRGDAARWPVGGDLSLFIERIAYHGIAGLLNERTASMGDWPAAVTGYWHEQAIALAMWELSHQALLSDLLFAFAKAGVDALLLKGTALAYDLYPVPATRARGDSDLLVAQTDLAAARSIFVQLGYRRPQLDEGIADDLALQEIWSLRGAAGTTHHFDLHWQLINAPALAGLLGEEMCAVGPLPLPRLAPTARAMSRQLTLLHTCIHRAMHLTSPYFVDGVTYYGGDRLIWAKDIDLLAGALAAEEWQSFASVALEQGVAKVCLAGLETARHLLGTDIPESVRGALAAAGAEPASAYLLGSGRARRAWRDLNSVRGWSRKLAYIAARAFPTASFMRAKYPHSGRSPLALLHLRRIVELVLPRPGGKVRS